jgi:putative colanic acid biosynthesis UDP-glucose lipid carrier transferase
MIDKGYNKLQQFFFFLTYLLALNVSFIAAAIITGYSHEKLTDTRYFLLILFINILWSILLRSFRLYKRSTRGKLFITFLQPYAIVALFTFLYIAVFRMSDLFIMMVYIYILLPVSSFIFYFSTLLIINIVESRSTRVRKYIVIGLNSTSVQFVKNVKEEYPTQMKFMGYFDDIEGIENPILIKGDLNQVREFLLSNEVDEVYCSVQKLSSEKIIELINFCDANLIRIHFLPEFFTFLSRKSVRFELEYAMMKHPVLSIRKEPLENVTNQIIKRTFDIFFSLFVIVGFISWMMPIIAIIIKLSSKGPIFFTQRRSGKNNKVFEMLKFRSMYVNKEANTKQATKDDKRITPIGKILRKTSLDELPNFINVLLGNMTVVGPRPHMLKHTEDYSKIIDKFMVRQFGKPGITGYAQVNGFRGQTDDPVKMMKRVEYDVYYLENWSFGLDIQIILQTLWQVLTRPAE